MRWMRSSSLAVVCTLLFAVGAGAARGHEAHRQATSVTDEATQDERPSQPLESAAEPAREPTLELARTEPPAESNSHSTHQPHAHAAAPTEPVSVLDWLGRLHPMVIHFPIALFFAALVAEILFIVTREEMFRHALRFSLWGGAMSAAIAAPLGWIFAASGAGEEGWILEAHRWAGTAALCLGVVVLWVGERTERADGSRLLLRISLAVQASLIGGVGFLGGSLLYGFDHLWRGF